MWFYKYSMTYYDEFDNVERKEEGIIVGATYSAAVENLTKYYGEDAIIELSITQVNMSESILTEEEIKDNFSIDIFLKK